MAQGIWTPLVRPTALRYLPIVRVSFHTEDACYQTKGEYVGPNDIDPTNQVMGVTTTKTLSAAAGSFTVQLQGDDWLFKLKPNDMVVIQMGYKTSEGNDLKTVMVGLIDTVTRVRSMSPDGQPAVATTITGRDFGKVLLKSMLRFYPQLSIAGKQAADAQKFFLTSEGWITLMKYFTSEHTIKGTPPDILDTIMRFLLQKLNRVSWAVWDETHTEPVKKTVQIGNVMRYIFQKLDILLPMAMNADQYEGALWNLMERTAIKPFSEMFVDVRPASEVWNNSGKPMVVTGTIAKTASDYFAPTSADGDGTYPENGVRFGSDQSVVSVFYRLAPFDTEPWRAIVAHDLQAYDVMDENLSFSDNEHFNLFWVGTQVNALGLDLKITSPPIMIEENVTRYGLAPFEVELEGIDLTPTGADAEAVDADKTKKSADMLALAKSWTEKLASWYKDNHTYLSGSMTVRGKGEYKVGQALIREGLGLEFYIEGVVNTFTVYERWTTQLQLTRGRPITREV